MEPTTTRQRVIVEVIVHDDAVAALLEAMWWVAAEAIALEPHRYLFVIDVAAEMTTAADYAVRRIHKAAAQLDLTLATGETDVAALTGA